jgi:hypothetical protein
MKKGNLVLILLLMSLIVIHFSENAEATPMLMLKSGIIEYQVIDNSTNDDSLLDGVVLFNGAIESFIVNVSAGLTKPIIGSATYPQIDLSSVNVNLNPGELEIAFTDTGFSSADFASTLIAFYTSVGGTTTGNVSFESYWDPGNNEFARTNLLSSMGPFYPMAFSDVDASNFFGANPFSLTIVATITHTAFGQITSFDAHMSPVPEPASMFLFGAGLVGLAGLGRRKLFQK